jgi:proteasome lid subunit RPN8/RPN11
MKIKSFFKNTDQPKAPIIVINSKVLSKAITLVQKNTNEIMLFGVVENIKENSYEITDFLIPPQEKNSAAFVTTDDEKYTEWLMQMDRELRQKLKAHFHSHPKMGVTPSSTDISTIEDKVQNIKDFYIRIIMNQDLDIRVDFFDLKNNLLYEEIDIYLKDTNIDSFYIKFNTNGVHFIAVNKELEEDQKELEEKTKKQLKYTSPTSHYGKGIVIIPKQEKTKEEENEQIHNMYDFYDGLELLHEALSDDDSLTYEDLRKHEEGFKKEIDTYLKVQGHNKKQPLLKLLEKEYPYLKRGRI